MARKSRRREDKHEARVNRGNQQLREDLNKRQFGNDWTLDWFNPKGLQLDCIDSFIKNTFTIINGPSGSGKTSTALWCALHSLKNRDASQIVFIKNPVECSDDLIGYLSGNEQDKLSAHFDTTKRIFHQFMSKNKLECDISKDKIRLTIPNFLLGATLPNAVVIIDEGQTMSPPIMKMLLERCGENSKYIILGDPTQRYAAKKRADGFSDLIERVTVPIPHTLDARTSKYPRDFGYIKMTRHDNQRSEGSKLINMIYEG